MIDVASWPPATLRALNLRLFDEPDYQYDLDSIAGFEPGEATRRRIANMKDAKIRRVVDAAPMCAPGEAAAFRDWWAAWMPLCAGMQVWPDGNHRVGMMVAELVAEEAGFTMVLDEVDTTELRERSKAIVMDLWRTPKQIQPANLLDAEQPLRAFYESFKARLRIDALDAPASGES